MSELLAKATPLITIGVALALGFRAGVWNIGAEGQLVMGGLCGGAVALALEYRWILGDASDSVGWNSHWSCMGSNSSIPQGSFNTNEILVSLMLTYVAILLAQCHGPRTLA